MRRTFDVSLALVRRDRRWLVAQRHDDAHLGGLWEFPGGKREPGESAVDAALRELYEECGVRGNAMREMEMIEVDYGDRIVRLTPVLCKWESGEARPIGSRDCRWVDDAELVQLEMPEVNAEIIRRALAMQGD